MPASTHIEDDHDDYDNDNWECTWCDGEGEEDSDDPLWDDCDKYGMTKCKACRGTGLRKNQWLF